MYHQAATQTIRVALRQFQKKVGDRVRDQVLEKTAGLLKGKKIDSVKLVRKLRNEWDH